MTRRATAVAPGTADRTPRARVLIAALAASLTLGACLDPLVSDEVDQGDLILPAGATVPLIEDDAVLAGQIDENDGLDGDLVPLLRGFLDGEAVQFWDFGPSPAAAAPLYRLVRADPTGFFVVGDQRFLPVDDHPAIVDVIPGDAGYSPFWALSIAEVTDAWDGQRITSFEALEEARRQGLVGPLMPLDRVFNCPIVLASTRLELPDGTLREPVPAYYAGYETTYFDFERFQSEDLTVPIGRVYRLRREGGEPLSEPFRGVDMSGDGDARDSNDVFSAGHSTDGNSALVELVDVVVPVDYGSIDTTGDDQRADAMAESDLAGVAAASSPAGGTVRPVAIYPQGTLLNLPLAPAIEP